ncbi:MAG TPA: hypothetical protein VGH97_06445 [Thermoanaerobaculia bacterium]|jgi:hypothetical protein
MSVLYLHFDIPERANRLVKLQKSGAHIVVAEPRWPSFFELAKREKPYAIAIDFTGSPSHALETADYMSKARETKDAALFLLRVPSDRVEAVTKRLPQATIVTEVELSGRLTQMEREAEARAREKKEAAAAAKKAARAAKAAAAGKLKPAPPPPVKAKPAPAAKPPGGARPKAAPAAQAAPGVHAAKKKSKPKPAKKASAASSKKPVKKKK